MFCVCMEAFHASKEEEARDRAKMKKKKEEEEREEENFFRVGSQSSRFASLS